LHLGDFAREKENFKMYKKLGSDGKYSKS